MGISAVGIIGAGTMGSGIAINAAQHGIEVRILDANREAAEKAIADARSFYARAAEKGRMSQGVADAAAERISPVSSFDGFTDVDLVIEAVFEDFALKVDVFEKLCRSIPTETLIATNTSCLRVSDLARGVSRPERFLGLHYFSPAQVNPIVEVVKGNSTADETIEAAIGFCRQTGKQPIRCKDSYGFAINRFFCPYTNEAARALDDGLASPAAIDAIAREAVGAAAGPFFVMNIIKPRINLHAIRNLRPLGAFYEPAASMAATGDAGRSWEIGEVFEVDAETRKAVSDRLLCGCFLPVLQALDEEVAAPTEIDLGAREALKFSKPPCGLMDRLGREEVARIIGPTIARYGVAEPHAIEQVGSLTARG